MGKVVHTSIVGYVVIRSLNSIVVSSLKCDFADAGSMPCIGRPCNLINIALQHYSSKRVQGLPPVQAL